MKGNSGADWGRSGNVRPRRIALHRKQECAAASVDAVAVLNVELTVRGGSPHAREAGNSICTRHKTGLVVYG